MEIKKRVKYWNSGAQSHLSREIIHLRRVKSDALSHVRDGKVNISHFTDNNNYRVGVQDKYSFRLMHAL